VVSARELTEAFTPTTDEIAWAKAKTTSERRLLALLVLLKCYQRLGYFPKLAEVPEVVVGHVRGKLELAQDVAAAYESDRTLWRYREFVRDLLGVVYEPVRVRAIAEKAIRTAVQTKDNPADLINVALEELVRQSCELPGYTTLDAMVTSIRAEVNSGFFAMVAGRVSQVDRVRLARLLVVDPVTRRSEFDRLKAPAQAATLGKFKQRLKHLADLDALGQNSGVARGRLAGQNRALRWRSAGDRRGRPAQGRE
jgi:hypothetical protein